MDKKQILSIAIPVGVVVSIQGFHALRSYNLGVKAAQVVCEEMKTAPNIKVALQRSLPELKGISTGRFESIAENSMKAELKRCPAVISAVKNHMSTAF